MASGSSSPSCPPETVSVQLVIPTLLFWAVACFGRSTCRDFQGGQNLSNSSNNHFEDERSQGLATHRSSWHVRAFSPEVPSGSRFLGPFPSHFAVNSADRGSRSV